MGSMSGFDSQGEFDELLLPKDIGSGVVTPAARQLAAQTNLGIIGGTAFAPVVSGISASAATLPITGLAAAQGGSVTVTGGTSSTSGNAGGAVGLVGGLPGATGVGGAASLTGAIGGATSGAGGAATVTGGAGTTNAVGGAASVTGGAGQGTGAGAVASLTGGAGGGGATGNGGVAKAVGGASTATNGDGGAAQLTGGLGTGTGAGGAVTITSGAAGATGVAGAVTISVGAATAGAGSNMTLTAGSGAGGTAAGGNLNLVAGTAVSTGTPGEVQVNGNSAIEVISLNYISTLATQTIFTATRAVRVKAIMGRTRVAGSGGACTMAFFKAATTVAVGSGVALHTGSFNLVGTADANQTLTLSTTVSDVTLAAGDSIGYVLTGTATSAVGNVTVHVVPV